MNTEKNDFLFYTDWDERVTGSASAFAGRLIATNATWQAPKSNVHTLIKKYLIGIFNTKYLVAQW